VALWATIVGNQIILVPVQQYLVRRLPHGLSDVRLPEVGDGVGCRFCLTFSGVIIGRDPIWLGIWRPAILLYNMRQLVSQQVMSLRRLRVVHARPKHHMVPYRIRQRIHRSC